MPKFSQKLVSWYRQHARDLPWRRTKDPYKIWISEVMLQQTTVNTVVPYYQRWVQRFPTIRHVARAQEQTILRIWQGLGYYQRAKNIHKAAKIMVEKYAGRISSDPQILKTLPGFGPYTINAVLSIAYGRKVSLIDANVRRVVMRLLAIKGFSDTSQDKVIQRFLDARIPIEEPGIFNQALMELGALVCRSRAPMCLKCPIRETCQAYLKGMQEIIPLSKRKKIQDLDVAVGIIKKRGRYFIQKRPSNGLLGDLWEFPGGKVEKGETPTQALRRELKEELGIELVLSQHIIFFYIFVDIVH